MWYLWENLWCYSYYVNDLVLWCPWIESRFGILANDTVLSLWWLKGSGIYKRYVHLLHRPELDAYFGQKIWVFLNHFPSWGISCPGRQKSPESQDCNVRKRIMSKTLKYKASEEWTSAPALSVSVSDRLSDKCDERSLLLEVENHCQQRLISISECLAIPINLIVVMPILINTICNSLPTCPVSLLSDYD